MSILDPPRAIARGLLTLVRHQPGARLYLRGGADPDATLERAADGTWRVAPEQADEPLELTDDTVEGLVAEAAYRRRHGYDDDTTIATVDVDTGGGGDA